MGEGDTANACAGRHGVADVHILTSTLEPTIANHHVFHRPDELAMSSLLHVVFVDWNTRPI